MAWGNWKMNTKFLCNLSSHFRFIISISLLMQDNHDFSIFRIGFITMELLKTTLNGVLYSHLKILISTSSWIWRITYIEGWGYKKLQQNRKHCLFHSVYRSMKENKWIFKYLFHLFQGPDPFFFFFGAPLAGALWIQTWSTTLLSTELPHQRKAFFRLFLS